jgi:ATP-dependent DNA ligase
LLPGAVTFYAFDILVSDGDDVRKAAAVNAQGQLGQAAGAARRRHPLADFEQGEIGPDLFRHACLMGLEGLVSKHRESTYRADCRNFIGFAWQKRWRHGHIAPRRSASRRRT